MGWVSLISFSHPPNHLKSNLDKKWELGHVSFLLAKCVQKKGDALKSNWWEACPGTWVNGTWVNGYMGKWVHGYIRTCSEKGKRVLGYLIYWYRLMIIFVLSAVIFQIWLSPDGTPMHVYLTQVPTMVALTTPPGQRTGSTVTGPVSDSTVAEVS